jgi:flagellar hook-associated protein 2
MAAIFQASGLASGMDSASIVDNYVNVEKIPIARIQKQQDDVKTKISSLGNLKSRLASLQAVADDLKKNGVRVNTVQGENTAFTATPDSKALPGNYNVKVTSLASAAKWMSSGLSSASLASEGLREGKFRISVDGVAYGDTTNPLDASDKYFTVTEGMSLESVATAINSKGGPFAASVVEASDGKHIVLAGTRLGYTPPDDPSDPVAVAAAKAAALSVSFEETGAVGVSLSSGAATLSAPTNATVVLDDALAFERRTNSLTDVLPGVKLDLKSLTAAGGENLIVTQDNAASKGRVQKLVDAINGVFSLIDLSTTSTAGKPGEPGTAAPLAGDTTLRRIRSLIGSVVSPKVVDGSSINGLADLGVTFDKTGYVGFNPNSVDFNKVLAERPETVAQFFQKEGGFAASISSIVLSSNSMVATRTKGLNDSTRVMQARIDQIQKNVDAFKLRMQTSFQSMETIISKMNSIGSYMSQQQNAQYIAAKNQK